MPVYSCSRCKKSVPFKQIKYDRNKDLVCTDCLSESYEALKEYKHNVPKQKSSFYCEHCHFKFTHKKGTRVNLRCPYCGGKELVELKPEQDVDDLIEDSMNSRYDY